MTEQLTKIAGELFEEQAIKEHAVPSAGKISVKAYEEFSLRLQQEKPRGETPEGKAQMQQEKQAQEQQEQVQKVLTRHRGRSM